MTQAAINLPDKVLDVFEPDRGSVQYRAMYGGRGSAKSQSAAMMAAFWGYVEPLRILCTRELQVSIKDSFHRELKDAIERTPWMAEHYDVGVDYLRGKNGTEFVFRGLRHNTSSIKSLAGIDLTIIEEAEDVPEDSWLALEATVFRTVKSEIWAIWNPRNENSPVDKRFRKSPPESSLICEINWQDNPFFPSGLNALRSRERTRLDAATYSHIWDGAYLKNSDAQVFFGKWHIDQFYPDETWQGPYMGVDFGFRPDPLVAVKCWVHDETLFIEKEAYGVGIEIDDTHRFICDVIPEFDQYICRADSAEPKTISYLQRHGFPRMEGVKKWPNSIAEGIRFIRGFKSVIIHPNCKGTIDDFRMYSHKIDKLSGDILPDVVDANNHAPDAVRYAIAPLIKSQAAGKMVIRI